MIGAWRYETWTGNRHYWIARHNGTFEVKEAGYSDVCEDAEPRTEFKGSWENCVHYIDARWQEDVEYNMSI